MCTPKAPKAEKRLPTPPQAPGMGTADDIRFGDRGLLEEKEQLESQKYGTSQLRAKRGKGKAGRKGLGIKMRDRGYAPKPKAKDTKDRNKVGDGLYRTEESARKAGKRNNPVNIQTAINTTGAKYMQEHYAQEKGARASNVGTNGPQRIVRKRGGYGESVGATLSLSGASDRRTGGQQRR